MPSTEDDKLKTAYEQLCDTYHKIDDFRTKLLGFLPLVSGAGIFFLLNENIFPSLTNEASTNEPSKGFDFLLPIGIFGVVITLGLFCYELYGIKKCHAVIEAGQQIERQMGVNGHFMTRPREITIARERIRINEPFAAGLIYPAVLAAWAFLALIPVPHIGDSSVPGSYSLAAWVAISVFLLGFIISILYNHGLWMKTREKFKLVEKRLQRRKKPKPVKELLQSRNTLYISESKIGHFYDRLEDPPMQKRSRIGKVVDSVRGFFHLDIILSFLNPDVTDDKDLEEIIAVAKHSILQAIVVEDIAHVVIDEKSSDIYSAGEILCYAGRASISITDDKDLIAETKNVSRSSHKRIKERRKIQEKILWLKDREIQTVLLTFPVGNIVLAAIASAEFIDMDTLSSYHDQELGILGMIQEKAGDVIFLDPLWVWYKMPLRAVV